ncbi:MAG: hypothetical protein ACOYI4_00955 [Christensenellales bacterium]|jgi:cell division protein FtsL
MLVNQKSNLAYKMEATAQPYAIPQRRPRQDIPLPKPRERQRVEHSRQRSAIRAQEKNKRAYRGVLVFMVLALFALFSIVVWRYALINTRNNQINDLRAQISQELDVQDRLQMQLTSAQNLENIKQRAAELGLDFPDEDQVYYYPSSGSKVEEGGN